MNLDKETSGMLYKKPKNLLADTTQKTPKHCFFHQKTQMRPLPLQNTFRHLSSVMYDKTMTQKNSWNPQIPADLIRNASSKHSVFYLLQCLKYEPGSLTRARVRRIPAFLSVVFTTFNSILWMNRFVKSNFSILSFVLITVQSCIFPYAKNQS